MVIARHFDLALGVPLLDVAGTSRRSNVKASDLLARAKDTKVASEFFRALNDRRILDSDLGCARGEVIEVVLKQMWDKQTAVAANGNHRSEATVTGMDLLHTFKKIIIADEPQLNLDYWSFWTDCAKLLIEVRPMHPKWLKRDTEICNDAAATSCISYEAGKVLLAGGSLDSTSMCKVAEVLRKRIEVSGDRYSNAAFEHSSGHTPQQPYLQASAAETPSRTACDAEEGEGRSTEQAVKPVDESRDGNGGLMQWAETSGVKHENSMDATNGADVRERSTALPSVRQASAARKKQRRGGRRLFRTRK